MYEVARYSKWVIANIPFTLNFSGESAQRHQELLDIQSKCTKSLLTAIVGQYFGMSSYGGFYFFEELSYPFTY